VRREDLRLLALLTTVSVVVRDAECRIAWCNDTAVAMMGRERGALMGRSPTDLHPRAAAEEREAMFRGVMERRGAVSVRAVMGDRRVVCTVLPLDAESFGHDGTLTLQVAGEPGAGVAGEPAAGLLGGAAGESVGGAAAGSAGDGVEQRGGGAAVPGLLATPLLSRLKVLSPRELDVLHFVASGRSTAEAAGELERSAKTVDKHIESIHKKLETSSRAELVMFAAERGLHLFTREEWGRIVAGYERVRRST
jgi:DNA-binding CsgD family transcriptional regulator